MAAPLGVYFFALLTTLVVTGSSTIGAHEMIAIGALGGLSVVLMRGLKMLSEHEIGTSDDAEQEAATHRHRPFVRVPSRVRDYLQLHGVAFVPRLHRRAVGAQELAEQLHRSGHRIAKPVMVKADGTLWMVVIPASERLDLSAVGRTLCAEKVDLAPEPDFASSFPECEVGAEPPFGRLYHVPTLVERDLARDGEIAFHGGSHDESIELDFADYARVERPLVAHVATGA